MPTYFQRPENALKRANEFIDVGKKQRALDALYDVIKSKKHRTWQKIHEPIMEKYLQLCVELRKSHIAKEGLYQYKNICQQVNIKSLEDVVRKYIQLAEEKCEAARAESHQVVLDVDDLDEPNKPESLLLKAVSGEDTQDRTDRAILTPWVKFLWESYRQCLDLLRNNSRVEELYQDLAQQAFKFCLKYGRKTEFRKLCDNLRTHLSHVHKHQHQQTAINLNNPASQAMHLETRLVQLDSAINMELWQEAFKAVEDIHGLIQLSKKAPRPSLMANYYQKLGLVFWKSGNPLFHASTLHRLFHLSKEQRKNLSPEELQRMASRVLCATLAVPIPASRNAIDALLEMEESTVEKTKRLATLLMLQTPPNRQGLIKDIAKYGVVQHVHPELQNLYRNLEVEFHPLRLYTRVKSSIEFITQNDDLAQYVPALEDIIVTRVLRQVSQVYQTIEFSRFAALVPFTTKFRLERIIVNAAKMLELQVRIDHRNSSLSFGTDLGVAHKEEVPEGPYIQSMPSEQIRNQLTFMASALHKAILILQPKEHKVQREELKSQIVNSYKLTSKKEHTRILERRQIIENRKEELEHLNEEREQQEYQAQEVQRKRAHEQEMARLEREAQERELQRRQEETKEIQKRHAMERIEQLKKSDLGAKVVQNMDEEDLANMDVEDIMAKQVEHLEREKRELRERLKNQERKIDYLVRARRLAEIPILEKLYEEEKVKDREFWEKQEIERIERMKEARKLELETRDRLLRMRGDRMEFMEQIMERRKKTYKDKVADFEKKLAEEHRKRLLDRKVKRKEERRQKYIKEKEEEEQRIRDEALLREHEEKERLEQEMQEEREREYREKIEKLEQQAAKQLAREREIEEREAKKRETDHRDVERVREEHRVPVRSDAARSEPEEWRREPSETTEKKTWRPSPSEGGGWRERVKEKQESWKKELDDGHGEEEAWRKPADKEKIVARDFPDRAQLRRDPDRSPTRGDADIPIRDERDRPTPRVDRERPLPRDDRDRRLLRDEVDRPPIRDDRDRLPLRDIRDRPPLKDDRDRPPLRDNRDRPSFRDERDRQTLRDSRDFREIPRDDRDRGLPRDDRERRRSPGGGGGPWRDRVPVRGDREGGRDSWRDRAPPREDAWRDRGTPRDDRDKRMDEREKRFDDKERRGGDRWGSRDERGVREEGSWRSREGGREDAWRDRAPDREKNWGRDDMRDRRDDRGRRDDMPDKKDDRERNPPRDRDDRDDSWRKGEPPRGAPAKEGGRWKDRDNKPPEKQDKDKREEPEDDGWTTVRYN